MLSSKRRIFILVIGLALLVEFTAHAGTVCTDILNKFLASVESLDGAYADAKATEFDKQKRAPQVMGLLNRAFFPMLNQFRDSVSSLKPSDVAARVHIDSQKTPIMTGQYESAVAQIPSWQSIINHNASQVKRVYKMDKNPRVISAQKFIYINPDEERTKRLGIFVEQLSLVITPVGSYGDQFAKNLLRTTQILMEVADEKMRDISEKTYVENKDLLKSETARAAGVSSEKSIPDQTPLGALMEGIMSFQQLLNLVLAEKIPGIDNGADAIRAFVNGGATSMGLTSEITMRLPIGVTGPSAISGYGFKDALALDPKTGKLVLTEAMKESLKELSDMNDALNRRPHSVCPMATFWRGRSERDAKVTVPAGVAAPGRDFKTGLQYLAESYLSVFNAVEAQNPSRLH